MKGIVELQGHAHHPHATQQVVGVRVGNEEVVNAIVSNTGSLHLRENAIPASRIHKQHGTVCGM